MQLLTDEGFVLVRRATETANPFPTGFINLIAFILVWKLRYRMVNLMVIM